MESTSVNLKNKAYAKKCVQFIDKRGYKELAKELDVTPQAVINWRSRGIPKAYTKYLKIAYKDEFK